MKLTLQLQMLPDEKQTKDLLATMIRFNSAASFAAELGFAAGVFSQPSIHKLAYRKIRDQFGLSSQMSVRAIGKAVVCFSGDKKVCPIFREFGAISYDEKNLSFKGLDKISITTLAGREKISIVYGQYQKERFDRIKGQRDLIFKDGKFYLYCIIDLPENPPIKIEDFLGVDLGIANIATDSTGNQFSGEKIERNRRRRNTARKQYQRKGTKNAKRRLKKMSGKQARYQRHVNHEISKKIVKKAKALEVGIALENLKGINGRSKKTVSKSFRRKLGNWGFSQLRSFIEYKAKLAGVPVVAIDPRNTSRTCNVCKHCEKANRKSQSVFRCKQCGHSENADINAAKNIRILGLGCYKPTPKAAG